MQGVVPIAPSGRRDAAEFPLRPGVQDVAIVGLHRVLGVAGQHRAVAV